MGNKDDRLLLAVQRPSSLNASGLMVDGRSSTRSGRPKLMHGFVQARERSLTSGCVGEFHLWAVPETPMPPPIILRCVQRTLNGVCN